MFEIIILAVLFTAMLAAPIAGACIYYKTRQSEILHIKQERVRSPRYFGEFFSKMVQEKLPDIKGNIIHLSRDEAFLNADSAEKKDYEEEMTKMVIAREKPFTPPATTKSYKKEIYSAKDASLLHEGTKIRAMYCKTSAILWNGTKVVRWVDAEETLAIYDKCDLGISASAGELLSVGYECDFRRLYAPEIRLGQYPGSTLTPEEGKNPKIYHLPVQDNKERNMRYISKEMINEEGVVDFSVLSRRNVTVTEDIIVQGDVRSHKGVRLCDGAVVCGNVFAEDDVLLGKNAVVLGSIFSQRSIHLEEGAAVGQRGKICSMIAREQITFEGNNFVFGYVSCERSGSVLAGPEHRKLPEKPEFLENPTYMKHLRFENCAEFEQVDKQGFRKEKRLQDVVIPQGAIKINKSMFFSCKELSKVELPATVRSIGDYAFADCESLQDLTGFENMQLEKIGISAFENCRKITSITLPDTVTFIGANAFAGCTSLKELSAPGHLEGCEGLKKVGGENTHVLFREIVREEEQEEQEEQEV